jgi:hypothetical protein
MCVLASRVSVLHCMAYCSPLHHQLVLLFILGWYPWAVICSHVCAHANERPAPRLWRTFRPPPSLRWAVSCMCVFAFVSRHSLTLSTSFHPDDDAPNDVLDASPWWRADTRLTCSNRRSIDAEHNSTCHQCAPSRHPALRVPPSCTWRVPPSCTWRVVCCFLQCTCRVCTCGFASLTHPLPRHHSAAHIFSALWLGTCGLSFAHLPVLIQMRYLRRMRVLRVLKFSYPPPCPPCTAAHPRAHADQRSTRSNRRSARH